MKFSIQAKNKTQSIIKLTLQTIFSFIVYVIYKELKINVDVIFVGLILGVLSAHLSKDERIISTMDNVDLSIIINFILFLSYCVLF